MATPKKGPVTRTERDQFARTLKQYGFNISYRIGKKNSPSTKAAVTRLYREHRYIYNRKSTQPVHFEAYKSAKEKRLVERILGPEARTPGGFFSQVPEGVNPGEYSLRVVGNEIREEIAGRMADVIIPLDTEDIVSKEPRAVKEMVDATIEAHRKTEGRKLKQAMLMVGGNEGNSFKVANMGNYMRSLFFRTVVHGNRGKMTREQFDEKFQLKLIYEPTKKKAAGKKKNSRSGPAKRKRKK